MKRLFLLTLLLLFSLCFSASATPALTKRQVKNLYAFAKAYGYAKYFYPIKNKERINWNYVAVTGAQTIVNAPDDTALQQELSKFFKLVSPLLSFHLSSEKVNPVKIATPTSGTYYYNLHKGLGQDKAELPLLTRKLIGSLYQSSIVAADAGKYAELAAAGTILTADSLYTTNITENLLCSLPLTLAEQAYNSHIAPKQFTRNYKLNLSAQQDQLATIIIFWNVFQHFYPYLENTNWEQVFFETMYSLHPSMTENDFVRAASKLTTSLNDGHASLSFMNSSGIYKKGPGAPALETGWAEGKLIVTQSRLGDNILQQGDIIEEINSTDAAVLVEQLKKNFSYANKQNGNLLAAERVFNTYLAGGNAVTLSVTDKLGITKEIRLDPGAFRLSQALHVKPVIHEAQPGIFYIDAARVSEKVIQDNLAALKQAKGVVFDLRKRPTDAFTNTVLPYFIEAELETGNWSVPTYTFPDQQRVNYNPITKWYIKPNGETIAAPKAFLVGHNTFSYAETCAEIIDHYNLGTIVGGYTAGTNGNINFSAAGKLQVTWTGMKVLKRDGSPYHGVGVEPDILVQPTIADIRLNKDTQLDAAVSHLKSLQL